VELRSVSQDEINRGLGVGVTHQICQAFVNGSLQPVMNSSELGQKGVVSVGNITRETEEVITCIVSKKATKTGTTIDVARRLIGRQPKNY
jgi:hypothetical protein